MTYPTHYSKFNRFMLWTLNQPAWKQGLVGGVLYAVALIPVLLIVFVLAAANGSVSALSWSVVGVSLIFPILVFAVVYPAALRLATDRLTKVVGFVPTSREQIDLRVWLKKGVLPESDRLTAALPRYLEFIEPIASGRRLYQYRWLNNLLFGVFAFDIAITLLRLTVGGLNVFDYVSLVLFVVLLVATVPIKFKNGNPVARLLTARLRKLYRLRKIELEKR